MRITKKLPISPASLLGAAIGLLALILLFVGVAAQAISREPELAPGQRVVTIFDHGEKRSVITEADTVGETLERANISLSAGDIVEPAADTQFNTTDFTVNIYRAKPVTIVDGMRREHVLSPHSTPRDIVKNSETKLYEEDIVSMNRSQNPLVDGPGVQVTIDRATPLTLVLYGEKTTMRTQGETVADLLAEKEIVLAADDTLSVAESTEITEGMTVEIWRNGVQTVTEEQEIDFSVRTIQDADKDPSYKEVQTPGKKGKKSVTYEITMRNGEEIERKEIQSVELNAPVEEVVVVGAKFNYTGGPLNEAQINALGTCESGMTATRNSGNGFYGAFQFMPATWRTSAPAPYNNVLPHEAPLDAQKQAVQNLLSRSSIFTQFPGCASKMRAQGIL